MNQLGFKLKTGDDTLYSEWILSVSCIKNELFSKNEPHSAEP